MSVTEMISQLHHLQLEGYQRGAPSPGAQAIDVEIASEMTCRCGGSCRYDGYHRPGSYIALAVCCECGRETGF